MADILLVDDDPELADMLVSYLTAEGVTVSTANNGLVGIEKVKSADYDLVILDVMMPKLDGFGVLSHIRRYSTIPVLMLTAKGDDVDRIVGLELGADDYLAKPFNPRELLARIRAILRRSHVSNDNSELQTVIEAGGLCIDMSARLAKIGDQVLELTSTELNVLYLLMRHIGHVVSKAEISEQGIGRPLEKYDRSVDMHMSHLRKKLVEYDASLSIVTVRGQGYQLVNDD